MRLLLVGAFAYPHHQGSQVYFQEQARALRAAGAEVELLSYGPGRVPAAAHPQGGLPVHSIPGWAAPASRRSGPQTAKAFADLSLAFALRRLVAARRSPSGSGGNTQGPPVSASQAASKSASKNASSIESFHASSASWSFEGSTDSPIDAGARFAEGRFDAILAHHAEAALLALHTLPSARPPVVYCAHTLLEHELPQYLKSKHSIMFSSPFEPEGGFLEAPRRGSGANGTADGTRPAPARPGSGMTRSAMARFGRVIDQRIAARAEGWIALTQSAMRVMKAAGEAPGRLIAPPIPALEDAERMLLSNESVPGRAGRDAAAVARSHDLQPGDYFLYAGNLDPYQDLALLGAVARRRRRASPGAGGRGRASHAAGGGPPNQPLPIVVATHDERAPALLARTGRAGCDGLVVCRVQSADEANALLAGARASIVPRRSLGGFPIKLANSLAAGVPVIALHGAEWGLVDGLDALIGDLSDPVGSLARALERLELDPALAARLGEGARATHRRQHDPARVAAETLALLTEVAKPRR